MPKTDKPDPDAVSPAVAAITEVTGADAVMKVEFRGETFDVERRVLSSARYAIAVASDQMHVMIFELLGPLQASRFVALCERGESFVPVAREFLDAFSAAAGTGNSSTS